MKHEHDPSPDELEELWLQTDAAERAGIFASTPLDARALLEQTPAEGGRSMVRRIRVPHVAIAASVLLAVTVGGWMFANQIHSISMGGGRFAKAGAMVTVRTASRDFLSCFSGPRGTHRESCTPFDYDADGDVDLADYGAFQSVEFGEIRTR